MRKSKNGTLIVQNVGEASTGGGGGDFVMRDGKFLKSL